MELYDPLAEIIAFYQQQEKILLQSIARLMTEINTLKLQIKNEE